MESPSGTLRVTFATLRKRLIQQVKLQIDNGEFSERGLARMLGISQSQMHKVLRGSRPLQTQLADKLLATLNFSTTDLYSLDELQQILMQKLTGFSLAKTASAGGEFSTLTVNSETPTAIKMPVGSAEKPDRARVKRAG